GKQPEVSVPRASGADRPGDDIASVIGRRLLEAELARFDEFLHDRMIDADLFEFTVRKTIRSRIADVERQPIAHAVDVSEDDPAERGSRSSHRRARKAVDRVS